MDMVTERKPRVLTLAWFETLSAASLTLALAIPVFMEKVMRPRYEERFQEFRTANRESFVEEFEEARTRLRRSRGAITPEVVDVMESLFDEWGRVKINENRLDTLLTLRKHFFSGWMLSLMLNLFSIPYSEYSLSENLKLGQLAIFLFAVMLLASMWYVREQFSLDDSLSKFDINPMRENVGGSRRTGSLIALALSKGRELERSVEKALKESGVSYERNAVVGKSEGMTFRADFVVPSGDKPKYVIEVKQNIRPLATQHGYFLVYLRKHFPDADIVLVSDLVTALPSEIETLKLVWDHLVDFRHLDELKRIVRT
jgi:hypothetical protein